MRSPRAAGTFALAALLFGPGCGRKIGDDCQTNVDCSPQGDRQCDVSQPGGYCTVQGCDVHSCPDDALCVRFFPPEAFSRTCDPLTEGDSPSCGVHEICVAEGYCVEPRLERRFCMKSCGSNDDCREGYQCRATGIDPVTMQPTGAELLPGTAGEPPGSGQYCTGRSPPPPPPPDAGPDAPPPDGPADAGADAAADAPPDAPGDGAAGDADL